MHTKQGDFPSEGPCPNNSSNLWQAAHTLILLSICPSQKSKAVPHSSRLYKAAMNGAQSLILMTSGPPSGGLLSGQRLLESLLSISDEILIACRVDKDMRAILRIVL